MKYYAIETSQSLTHHGVKGMKWGVRRYQDYDGHRIGSTKAVKKAHDDAVKRMNENHVKTGDPTTDAEGEAFLKSSLDKHPIEKLSEIERYDSSVDIKKLRSEINFGTGEDEGRHYNCPNCAAAFEMVERGYSVTARPKLDGSNVENIESFFKGGKLKTCDGAESLFERYGIAKLGEKSKKATAAEDRLRDSIKKDYTKEQLLADPALARKLSAQFEKVKKESKEAFSAYWDTMNKACDEVKEKTLSDLKSQGNGARGIMVVGWDVGSLSGTRANTFHAFNYKVENGEPKFYDAQSHKDWSQNGGVDHSFFRDADPRDVFYMRTDNLELSENITQAVYSNKRRGK